MASARRIILLWPLCLLVALLVLGVETVGAQPGGSAGGGGFRLRDEGTPLGTVGTLDCVGGGVTCTASGGLGTLTISAGSGAVTSSGSPLIHQLSVFTTATDIRGVAVGTTGTYLRGVSAADPVFSTLTLPNAATVGDTFIATGTNAMGVVGAVALGQVPISQGTGTAWMWSATPALTSLTLSANTNQLTLGTTNTTTVTMASLTASRIFTLPDAASNPVRPLTCTAGDFVSAIAGTGVLTCGTPAGSGTVTSSGPPLLHQLPVFTTATNITGLTVGTTGQYLRGASAADPLWSTLTLPNAATTGDTFIATGTNAMGVVAAGATGAYFRGAGAGTAPIWSTLILPNAVVAGDTIIGSATNTYGAVTAVAAGAYFRSAGTGTASVWSTTTMPNTLSTGDLVTASSTNVGGVIAAVATGAFLRSAGVTTLPVWSTLTVPNAATTGDILAATGTNAVGVIPATTAGLVLTANGAGVASTYQDSAASTLIFTNKTLNAESTGNVVTLPFKKWLPAAGCNNATAGTIWDLPTTTPAAAACVTGTNTQKGVLQYLDTAGGFSAQLTEHLPADWTTTGGVDVNLIWTTSAISGNAKWTVSFICAATGATETDDTAFPTTGNGFNTVTTAVPGTANQVQTSTITGATLPTTGTGTCTTATSELLHIRVFRAGDDAADTCTCTTNLIGATLTYRRAM